MDNQDISIKTKGLSKLKQKCAHARTWVLLKKIINKILKGKYILSNKILLNLDILHVFVI